MSRPGKVEVSLPTKAEPAKYVGRIHDQCRGRPLYVVLDVGCGVGTFLRQLHQSNGGCDLKGCDVSAATLDPIGLCVQRGLRCLDAGDRQPHDAP